MASARREHRRQPPGNTPSHRSPRQQPAPQRPLWLPAALTAAVVAWTAAAHWPVLRAQAFCFDDHQYVFRNPLVQNPSWHAAGRFLAEVTHPSTVTGYYQPLSMISLMLDRATGGRNDDLHAFHRTSLLLHLANTALVVWLLRRLLGHPWAAAAGGLIWGLHPLTVESVAWLAERKTLLATFFALASLCVYVGYCHRGRWWRYVACALLFVLALMSKPTTTPLPVLMLLLDYWPLRRLSGRAVLEKAPLLVLAVVGGVITIVSQSQAAGLDAPTGADPARIALTIAHNLVFYPLKMIWPLHLTPHYPFPWPIGLHERMVLAGVVGAPLLLLAVLVSWRWTRAVLVGWLFFVLALLPTMNVVGFTHAIASMKFAYLAGIGLLLPLAALIAFVWNSPAPSAPQFSIPRLTFGAAVLLIAGAETYLTRNYLSQWRDTERLYRYVLAQVPTSFAFRHNLGEFLLEQGRFADAADQFKQVLAQRSDHWMANRSLATALHQLGQPDEAIRYLERAIEANPAYFQAQYELGIRLAEAGRYAEAVERDRAAMALRPNDYRPRSNLASALSAEGKNEEALAEYDAILRLKPDHARSHFNRGLVLQRLGRAAEARAAFGRALELDPNYPQAREKLLEVSTPTSSAPSSRPRQVQP